MLSSHASPLDNYLCLVAKYTIQNALDQLQIINIAMKKAFLETSGTGDNCMCGEDFDNIIEFIKKSLIQLCREIEEKGTFKKLQEIVTESQNPADESIQEDAGNKSEQEIMEEQSPKVSEKEMASHMLETENLGTMKQRLEIEKRYNESWEKSNCDQANSSIEQEDKQKHLEHERYRLLLEKEEKAAKSLTDFYQSKIHYLDEMLEYWTGEYDREMETIAHHIHLAENGIKGLETQISRQEENYQQFQVQVRLLYQKRKRINSARRIQRWWRAILQNRPKPISRRSPKRRGKPGLSEKKKTQPASRQVLNIRTQALASVPIKGLHKTDARKKTKNSK